MDIFFTLITNKREMTENETGPLLSLAMTMAIQTDLIPKSSNMTVLHRGAKLQSMTLF